MSRCIARLIHVCYLFFLNRKINMNLRVCLRFLSTVPFPLFDSFPDTYTQRNTLIYQWWLDMDAFAPKKRSNNDSSIPLDSFSVVLPPPNVTGTLHMGHCINSTLQDVLVRHRRMLDQWDRYRPDGEHRIPSRP